MNLENKIRLLPKDILSVIEKISSLADEMNVGAYLVGGFVRDLLLNQRNFDLDIVIENPRLCGPAHQNENVEGCGIVFAEKLHAILGGHILIHKRFGTAVLTLPNKIKLDIATARSEAYTEPAALPVVKFGSLYNDLFRRDFTINAMAVSINKRNFGELADYFGGLADLKNKKIRILHNLSFMDDPTRMLRAVRFEQRYGFRLEKLTLRLFNKAEKFKMLDRVNKHRTRDEFILMLKEDAVLDMLRRFNELYGFSFIHKDVKLSGLAFAGLKKLDRTIKIFHRQFPEKRVLDSWVILFTALLDGLGVNDIKNTCYDFALTKSDARRILSYHAEYEAIIKRLSAREIKPSLVYRLLEPLSFEAIVLLMAKTKKAVIINRLNLFLAAHNGIKLAVGGEDLKVLGLLPGPHFKEILTKTLHAKIDKIVISRDDEIKFIKKHGSRHIKS